MSTKTETEMPVAQGEITSGTNVSPAVRAANRVSHQLEQAEATIAQQKAEIKRLQQVARDAQRNTGTDGEIRLPVTDGQLRKACDALLAAVKADASKPNRSLKSQFLNDNGSAVFVGDATEEKRKTLDVVTPELTDAQRKVWRVAKDEIDATHTQWTRHESPKLIAGVKRLIKDPTAIASGGAKKDKDGKLIASRIGVRLARQKKDMGKPDLGKARSGQ